MRTRYSKRPTLAEIDAEEMATLLSRIPFRPECTHAAALNLEEAAASDRDGEVFDLCATLRQRRDHLSRRKRWIEPRIRHHQQSGTCSRKPFNATV